MARIRLSERQMDQHVAETSQSGTAAGTEPHRGRVWGGATRGRAVHRGGGRASDGERSTSAQRRTLSDVDVMSTVSPAPASRSS